MTYRIDRRQALATFGAVSLSGLLAACGDEGDGASSVTTSEGTTSTVEPKTSTSASLSKLFDESASCSVTPEETEGPYYFDVDSIRSDIREDRDGVLLRLALRVRDAKSCEPIENAVVDIWHCDALGSYSGFESASTGAAAAGGGSGPPTRRPTCAVRRRRMPTASSSSRRSIRAGTAAAPSTSTPRCTSTSRPSSRVSSSSTSPSTRPCTSASRIRRGPAATSFNDNDGIFNEALLVSAKRQGDGYLGLMTFDVTS